MKAKGVGKLSTFPHAFYSIVNFCWKPTFIGKKTGGKTKISRPAAAPCTFEERARSHSLSFTLELTVTSDYPILLDHSFLLASLFQ